MKQREYRTAWLIRPRTNLHVGDEALNGFSIVDKTVQRDVLTHLPCIYASSLKGALSEYVRVRLEKETEAKAIFGSDLQSPNESKKGSHRFFDAQLLFLPLPSNHSLYVQATSPGVLRRFAEKLNDFGFGSKVSISSFLEYVERLLSEGPVCLRKDRPGSILVGDYSKPISVRSDWEHELNQLESWAGGKTIVFFSDKDFELFYGDNSLPIIARNKLEKGESKNLWYEEVLPPETVLYTFICESSKPSLSDMLEEEEKDWIQIGANATIGYGYCHFECLFKSGTDAEK